ncbi:hypothetical protein TWF481_010716 [Arthrobotrys musiformis]|uniref:Uncharacterized protein n=1 Tax=Arthrobotrys musiformis TaxID=47236 RepID=A0AAV9W1J5_9PEZI
MAEEPQAKIFSGARSNGAADFVLEKDPPQKPATVSEDGSRGSESNEYKPSVAITRRHVEQGIAPCGCQTASHASTPAA